MGSITKGKDMATVIEDMIKEAKFWLITFHSHTGSREKEVGPDYKNRNEISEIKTET